MPLHQSGLTSRRELDHPGERVPVKIAAPAFEHVLKFNPNHDAHGRFSSSGGGKGGGASPNVKGRGTFDPSNPKTHPLGSIYGVEDFLVPTEDAVDIKTMLRYSNQRSHPMGTQYISGTGTLIPHETDKSSLFDLDTGKVYRKFPNSVIPRTR